MGKEKGDNKIWTLLCFPCCGGWKGSVDQGFYFCGCRVYSPNDFCTRDGFINCLVSQGSRTWIAIWVAFIWLLIQGAILRAIQPDTFKVNPVSIAGTHLGESSSYAMAVYFSWITDTTTCYGDITMARDPPNGRVALFFLSMIGMVLIAIGYGSVAAAVRNYLSHRGNTGFAFFDVIHDFLGKYLILTFITIYIGLLTIGAAIFMWFPYIEEATFNTDNSTLAQQFWGYDQSFYWGWVSWTTCGYGDQTHVSVTGRIGQIAYSIITIGFFTTSISMLSIQYERRFNALMHLRTSVALKAKSGKGSDAYVQDIIDDLGNEFKDDARAVAQLFKHELHQKGDRSSGGKPEKPKDDL